MSDERRRIARRVIAAAAAVLVAGALIPFACIRRPAATEPPSRATTPAGEPRDVRVLLVERAASASISVAGPYTIYPGGMDESVVLHRGPSLPKVGVRPTASGLAIGAREILGSGARIIPQRDGALAVNGRLYRGHLVVQRTSNGELRVINVLPVEPYLYSVLGSETYAGWPVAALESQAIVARSYALWRMAQRRDEPFDLHATVLDQNYLGVAKEEPRLRAAVDRTEGLVLLYQMKLFRCYYHSTCGGHTEAVENVFADPALLPLSGAPCGYCRGSKHYRWRRELSKAEIAEALRKRGLALKRLVSLELSARTPAGRVREVTLEASNGARFTWSAAEFRAKLGTRTLPSTFFEVRELGGRCEFRGRGFGHGVGMCQWGSKGMAEAGFSAEEILRHYYPAATLRRLYGGRGRI